MTDHNASQIPVPRAGDSDEVEIALETSRSLWTKGDGHEALRWLRRAADAAEQAGDDRRQLELARAAADLATAVGPSLLPPSPTNPPSGTAPARPHRSPPSAPPRRTESQAPSSTAETPHPPSSRQAHRIPPPAPCRDSGSHSLDSPSLGAPPPDIFPQSLSSEPTETSYPPLPPRNDDRARPTESPNPPPSHSPASLPSPPSPTPPAASTASLPPTDGALPLPAPPNWEVGPVRVSVKRSVRDETLLVVRPLGAGHAPPSGCEVGWLLMGDLADRTLEDFTVAGPDDQDS